MDDIVYWVVFYKTPLILLGLIVLLTLGNMWSNRSSKKDNNKDTK